MTHDIPHDLTPELAKRAACKAVETYAERFAKYAFTSRWVDDRQVEIGFAIAGKRMDGSLTVLARSLRLELDVPFVFRLFSTKAVEVIEHEAAHWIARAREGRIDE